MHDRQLEQLVETVVRAECRTAPVWKFSVPGRIEVFGKHTDYAGGRSLVAAVPRGFRVAATPSSDGGIVVIDARTDERMFYPARGELTAVTGWRKYVAAVIQRLRANFPDVDLSARIVFASDLPQAAGISSSSALVISIAEALIARAALDRTDLWRAAIRTIEDRATYFASIENGASFGPLAGDAGVGVHGGSEDHAAILMSVAGELRQFSYIPLRLRRVVRMPAGWTFVIASSGVSAPKGTMVLGDYNRLAASAATVASAWRQKYPDDTRSLGELAREKELMRFDLPQHLHDRLEHFVAEDARVAEATDALARGDIAVFGKLAGESQRDAERLLDNQVPETIDLVKLSVASGAAAASAFGAGWGGSVWALVPSADAEQWLGEWLRAYRVRYPQHPSTGFVSPPSDGIRTLVF
jgi:galactokinase